MPSEAEIKEFIDSREVLSKIELSKFIYGTKQTTTDRTNKWWIYTLQTKDLEKLYNEKQKRITHPDPNKEKILNLIATDERLRNSGTRNQVKYLRQFYDIKINRNTLMKWRKEICED